ncbi:MAG: Fe-S cluster assembly protein NifU [Methylicorpusculum sp.]|uniref:Fe-S cluster assembly protein NifU n=1 Tax=Methylicorpusculum sp. TaxID=2713644 RepID=UPI002721A8A7|nr:Fe-S cluster assembly protein NifU [Methylicorpusculum sp.]MDO8846744.1 Fe-S cluster assembly protein NifU [Methylicorpusculum sp.]MDO8939139.1 Fe-S cluster assembly protein NifU [Methylicorpusculum sp.]MDP2179151.1 Fe-S cluster assembly protein NifU [Methylicorpusculum sp.]MDP2201476.1 Fe-S cluster assembly protein NifU [Methylicorpusculum sp.]MDP3531382.1 Fe-S cluster assembly protein NifU [Methylicorpusculum sp.]
MWDYSEKVKDHFFNPKNAGAVAGANAIGEVGSISCGDALRLTLKVNEDTEVIEEAGFQTFGCGSAIASSSVLTEIIKGMTLDDALKVSNQDIAQELDGLPPEKMHCSVMGREALQAAVANYRGEEWKDDHEEGALICKCFAIDAVMIEEMVWANKLRTVEDVTNFTKAGGGCAACHEDIENILERVLKERGESFNPDAAPIETPVVAEKKPLTNLQRIKKIEAVLDSLRPQLMADGGDVELVEVVENTAYVNMTGACNGCQMAAMTIAGIQQRLMEVLGEFIKVVPASQMPKLVTIQEASHA